MVKIIPIENGYRIFNGNTVIGYVENETLYGLDREGYAVEICHIDNNNDIAGKLKEWRSQRLI